MNWNLVTEEHEELQVGEATSRLEDLRQRFLITMPAESIVYLYLTDLRLDGPSEERPAEMLRGCDAIVREHNSRDVRRFHTSSVSRLE